MKRQLTSNGFRGAFIIAAVFVCLVGAAGMASAWNFTVAAQEVKLSSNSFQFPTALFEDSKARHFVYKHSPSEWIRFFVVKSSDGVIRAAFDACDVCFRSKKGYVQTGDFMTCVNCGLKFRSDKINEIKGGCNPAPLARTVQGDKLVITLDDVLSGLRFFK